MYKRRITDTLTIQNATMHHAAAMGQLQRKVFPSLSDNELLTAKHFARHIEVFPEGQFVALIGDQVIASTSTFLTKFPEDEHTFLDVTGNLSLSTHDPEGEWMYGFDMGVDPAFRGLGLGRLFYKARSIVAQLLGIHGQVIVGMPSGYGKVMSELSFEEYYRQILASETFDPTVSMQMKMGFRPCGVIAEYLVDPKCGNYGVMMTLPSEQEVADPKLSGEQIADRIAQAMIVSEEMAA